MTETSLLQVPAVLTLNCSTALLALWVVVVTAVAARLLSGPDSVSHSVDDRNKRCGTVSDLSYARSGRDITWSSGRSVSTSPRPSIRNAKHEGIGGTTLIIDGCNGPLRMHRTLWSNQQQQHDSTSALSLLRTVDGETSIADERLDVIPALEKQVQFDRIRVIFDGVSNRRRAAKKWVSANNRVCVEVTDTSDEADNVIVSEVRRLQSHVKVRKIDTHAESTASEHDQGDDKTKDASSPTSMASTAVSADADITVEESDAVSVLQWARSFVRNGTRKPTELFRLTRTSDGPGKNRRLLKPLRLLRPESGCCLYAFTPSLAQSVQKNAVLLQQCQKLLHIEKVTLADPANMTVVVTDDIFLRERVMKVNGFVMTFEQLWTFLSDSV